MKRIIIFASGSGTNAANIIRYFHEKNTAEIVGVFCNVPGAGVLEKAEKAGVPTFLFDRYSLKTGEGLDEKITALQPDIIVLAGFLWLFPARLVKQFPHKIINIHPALLPAYGGKGMWGENVHKAVLANDEKMHGVTVHFVNEKYDEGEVILQESFPVMPGETLETVSSKIHEIEYRLLPMAIEKVLFQE